MLLEKVRSKSILIPDRTDIADRCGRRLTHHISELSGKLALPLARHDIDLHLKRDTANACPCKSSHDADLITVVLFVR